MAYFDYHTIQREEKTLQDIATYQLHDITKWKELAKINNLHYPYLVDSVEEKLVDPDHLLMWGDRIKLPIVNSVDRMSISTVNEATKEKIYDMSMGMDIALAYSTEDALRDHIAYLVADNNHGDLQTTKGVSNLKQSLSLRLLTAYGTLPYHPTYGSKLNTFIGSSISGETAQDIKNEIIRTCKTDPRVADVAINDFEIEGTNFWCELSIKPIDVATAFTMFVDTAQETISVS